MATVAPEIAFQWCPGHGAAAGFPFWNLEQWELKEKFAGVLTAGRMAKVAFDKAGIPAQVLYHNHANFVSIPDTSSVS